MLRRVVFVSLLASLLVSLTGCGRKATREDCEAVVDKNVELQLKALGVTEPATVAKRREEMRASLKDDIEKCIGKRVTDSMMSCVKTAETADKIDKCLR
jgi:cytochrome c biogenesis protein ResB